MPAIVTPAGPVYVTEVCWLVPDCGVQLRTLQFDGQVSPGVPFKEPSSQVSPMLGSVTPLPHTSGAFPLISPLTSVTQFSSLTAFAAPGSPGQAPLTSALPNALVTPSLAFCRHS